MPAVSVSSKRKKRQKGNPVLVRAARWLFAIFCAGFLTWSLFVPQSAGAVGRSIHGGLLGVLGGAAYLLPFVLAYGLLWYYRTEDWKGLVTMSLGAALCVLSASLLLGTVGRPEWGGSMGAALARSGLAALGRIGTFFVSVGSGLLGLQILFDIPWSRIVKRVATVLSDDYRGWQRGRRELKSLIGDTARKHLGRDVEGPTIAPIPLPASRGAAPTVAAPEPALALTPLLIEAADRPPGAEKAEPAPRRKRPAKGSGTDAQPDGASYRPPPLDLLRSKSSGTSTGRPSDAEISEAVTNLDRTLHSFEIDARVTGISPGPVITRYEVSPGPGVTVSSIVARADDIALSMKARGIRMIAPIPGKAAIGIEIPNQRPAAVTLREVLESPAMAEETAPLAFALGLSSDGTPLAADLQTMPHVLVAGATNSGKSVMVHSLIASILFRRRPDEVKLLLIDPKRIELTLYDGIPHLYDPTTPPADVRVITQAKQAARSLKALVRIMEDRYERFQAYRARDIQQFNREAARRGEPGEFFIIVVMDELADLMVVARDIVEDSVQRLAQMARAVGIHLVIATQRPSVDVLTGVIKANLPSRIAMRVASKVDSKVVIDGNGAEALLGKGDALYISPGQEPARIQGAFVSTTEIGALVDYLKAQCRPDYPLLDTMAGAAGEADLSQFGVEPLELSQALKLVLERRRVSQDLLKSQFGSSARATNLLSLLEIKGFINKPEGSNRWQIQFDKIEDYLSKHFPQVRLENRG
ncbi:MAG: DNA translocase FtsK [Elusimicrobiota bacterium]